MTPASGSGRRLPSWIGGFLEFTKHRTSPELFRRWAAIAAVSSALERRCWSITTGRKLHPNLFILLVSPPGIGKGEAIEPAQELMAATGKLNIAPDAMTKAAFWDVMAGGMKKYNGQSVDVFHSLIIASTELGVLLPAYDIAFLNVLNECYDCKNYMAEQTRSGGKKPVDNPHLSFLAGTQPSFMADVFPETVWGTGFAARLIMVYSDQRIRNKVFAAVEPEDYQLRRNLIEDLKTIASLHGEYLWDEPAAEALETWNNEDFAPIPDHPKLQHYSTRRRVHIIKLSMVFAASKRNELVVYEEDLQDARSLLLATEAMMPEIFKEMTVKGHAEVLTETFNFLWTLWLKTNRAKPIPEHTIVQFLRDRVPVGQIRFYIEAMERSNMIRNATIGTARWQQYVPVSKGEQYE